MNDVPAFMVYLQDRIDKGLPPYVVFHKSAELVKAAFLRRWNLVPTKVVPCVFDGEIGKYVPVTK